MTGPAARRAARPLVWHLRMLALALGAPILLFAGVLGWQYARAEQTRLEAEVLGSARLMAGVIDRDLADLRATLDALGTSAALDKGDYEGFHRRALRLTSDRLWIVLCDPAGRELVNTSVAWGEPLPHVPHPNAEQVQRSGRPFVSDLERSPVQERWVFYVTVPVLREGAVAYTLSFAVDPLRIQRLLIVDPAPQRGTTVADREGIIVARWQNHDRFVGRPIAPAARAALREPQGFWRGENLEGEAVLVAHSRVATSGWYVGAGILVADLNAPLSRTLAVLGALGTLLLGAGVLTSTWLGGRLARSIEALAQGARSIGRGEVPPPLASPVQEVGVVAGALSAAAIGLRERNRALQDSEAQFRAFFETQGMYNAVLQRDGGRWTIKVANVASRDFHKQDLERRDIAEFLSPEWLTLWTERLDAVVETEQSASLEYQFPDGRWFVSTLSPLPPQDCYKCVAVASLDVTERRLSEENNARLAAVVSSSQDAIVAFAADDERIIAWNSGAEALFGWREVEALGSPGRRLLPPEAAEEDGAFRRALAGEPVRLDTVRVTRTGDLVDVSLTATRMRTPAGRVIGVSMIMRDIRERKRYEARQQLLIRELHHRIRNTLATVQAIASSTARATRSVDEFRAAFSDRLIALGNTHSLLTDNAFEGVSLRALLKAELDPHDDGKDGPRVTYDGPPIRLPPEASVALGMGIHELTSNALRHGALSSPKGRVQVSWRIVTEPDGRTLVLDWIESDGPPVQPPTYKGFGSRLLERLLGSQLAGAVSMDFAGTGLRVRIETPLPRPDKPGPLTVRLLPDPPDGEGREGGAT